MLEICEILEPAVQGRTSPYLCKASDGKSYYVKGHAATASGLIKEWLAGSLAKTLDLPIPNFHIVYLDQALVKASGESASSCLGSGYLFASERINSVTEFKNEMLSKVKPLLQQEILLFDLWIQNEDRTLTNLGGNPNLLWESGNSKLHIIDHNLAFEKNFSKKDFWNTYVFRQQFIDYQLDLMEKQKFEIWLKNSLKDWDTNWAKIPDEWKESNQETLFLILNQR